MQDHTLVELFGMAMVTLICVAGIIVDGEVGNAVAVAGAAALGGAVGYVFKAFKNGGGGNNEEEVQESGESA